MSASRLIGCVWMQRAHHRELRQGLQRVVELDARQRRRERAVLRPHALAVDQHERRAVAGDERLEVGARVGRGEAGRDGGLARGRRSEGLRHGALLGWRRGF
jgi:hypothetical protein